RPTMRLCTVADHLHRRSPRLFSMDAVASILASAGNGMCQNLIRYLAWLVFLCCPLVVHATTYYVSTSGNNANSCTPTAQTCASSSCTTAKLTISGSSGGMSCLSAGDTLYIRGGTYSNASNYDNVIGYPNPPRSEEHTSELQSR